MKLNRGQKTSPFSILDLKPEAAICSRLGWVVTHDHTGNSDSSDLRGVSEAELVLEGGTWGW